MSDELRPFGDYREAGLAMPQIMPVAGTEPCILLHMEEEHYFASPNLGSSDHRALRTHPCEFYYQWAGNPDKEPDEDTPAMTFGKAVHKVVLEGREALERAYACEPVDDDMSRPLLRTMDDMRRLLRPAGLAVDGVKEALVSRCRNAFPRARIYDDIMDEHRRVGRKILKPDAWRRALISAAHITMHPQLREAFIGGKSEISVFWINEFGVRCRARLDCLRVVPETVNGREVLLAVVSDLKSFSNPMQIPVLRQIDNAAGANLGQAALYMEGVKALVEMLRWAKDDLRKVAPDATPEDIEWLKLVARCRRVRWHFVFYKSSGAPYADATIHEPSDPLIALAEHQLRMNFQAFRDYYASYGTSLWVNKGAPRHLADEGDIKPWLL